MFMNSHCGCEFRFGGRDRCFSNQENMDILDKSGSIDFNSNTVALFLFSKSNNVWDILILHMLYLTIKLTFFGVT